jgi:cell division protein FtsB
MANNEKVTEPARQAIDAHTLIRSISAFDAARNLSDIARAQHFEIERLRDENEQLRQRVAALEANRTVWCP